MRFPQLRQHRLILREDERIFNPIPVDVSNTSRAHSAFEERRRGFPSLAEPDRLFLDLGVIAEHRRLGTRDRWRETAAQLEREVFGRKPERDAVWFLARAGTRPECGEEATLAGERLREVAFTEPRDQPQRSVKIRLPGPVRPGNDVQMLQR